MLREKGIRVCLSVVVFCAVFGNCVSGADVLHLKDGKEWQDVTQTPEGKHLVAVAKFKQLISSGDGESALGELVNLKKTYPEIAGPDFDKFVEAEFLYADGKWFKAVKKYDELLDGWPESWLYETAMEREYSIAVAFLNGQKRKVLGMVKLSAFDDGEKTMRRIADRAGDAPISKRALIALAKGYQKKKEFLDAYEVWTEISSRWPTGEMGRTALLEMAQSLHSAYTSPNYDHTTLISAKTYYTNFRLRYPQLVLDHEIDEKLRIIEEQLAYKQYSVGEYYDRTGSVEAAKLYYEEVVKNWPGTSAAQMAQARIDAGKIGMPKRETQPKKLSRKLFEASSKFVDSWFGIVYLTGKSK